MELSQCPLCGRSCLNDKVDSVELRGDAAPKSRFDRRKPICIVYRGLFERCHALVSITEPVNWTATCRCGRLIRSTVLAPVGLESMEVWRSVLCYRCSALCSWDWQVLDEAPYTHVCYTRDPARLLGEKQHCPFKLEIRDLRSNIFTKLSHQ